MVGNPSATQPALADLCLAKCKSSGITTKRTRRAFHDRIGFLKNLATGGKGPKIKTAPSTPTSSRKTTTPNKITTPKQSAGKTTTPSKKRNIFSDDEDEEMGDDSGSEASITVSSAPRTQLSRRSKSTPKNYNVMDAGTFSADEDEHQVEAHDSAAFVDDSGDDYKNGVDF